jgi:hypothetical protein
MASDYREPATFPGGFPRPWQVRGPRIFRYLNQEYIDAFFDSGSLRLSSFVRFAEHSDEQRFDPDEGEAVAIAYGEPDGVVQVEYQLGAQSYVLSASVVESETLIEAFRVDGYFRIDNTTAFAAQIANTLPYFSGGLEGPCVYGEGRAHSRTGGFSLKDLDSDSDKGIGPKSLEIAQGAVSPSAYFLKERSFSHQAEYRLLWNSSREVSPTIDVVCPEAREFCTKIT